ncbi:hypothetical protein NSMM_370055 [Nitrosomonas mobilis]|uniref:Transposase n=1 Tax=Nitrosomonas mobilis TaxID=51642 RepID=A0A1G5SDJ2_9PROT|nr:hypothetical protein NSMM_370055 [Nitrosomonas mobilis]
MTRSKCFRDLPLGELYDIRFTSVLKMKTDLVNLSLAD